MYLECSFLCQVPRLDFRRSHIETSEAQDHRQTQLITMHCNALQCTALAAPFDKYGTDWYWKFPEVAGYAKPPSQVFVSFFAGRPQLCSWEFGLKKFCFGVIMASKHVNSGADLCLGTSIGNPRVPPSRLPPNVPKSQDAQRYKSPALARCKENVTRVLERSHHLQNTTSLRNPTISHLPGHP